MNHIPNDYMGLRPHPNHASHRSASFSHQGAGTPGAGEPGMGTAPEMMDGMIPSHAMSQDYRPNTIDTGPPRDMTIPVPVPNHQDNYARDTRLDNNSRIQPEFTATQQGAAPYPNNIDMRSHAKPQSAMRPERNERFSELLNSTIVSDHFDQYRTLRDDSGLGRDLDSPHESRYTPPGSHSTRVPVPDASPDSGVDTEEVYSRSRPLQRRKTLPSIVKREVDLSKLKGGAKGKAPVGDAVHSQQNLSQVETDTYIIENGIRKRVRAEVYAQPKHLTPAASNESLERPKELPKRYRLESPTRLRRSAGNRGSLPDVSQCKELQKTVMPRAEVSILSERRRKELIRQQEEDERKKQQEIVLRLGDVKVCTRYFRHAYQHVAFQWTSLFITQNLVCSYMQYCNVRGIYHCGIAILLNINVSYVVIFYTIGSNLRLKQKKRLALITLTANYCTTIHFSDTFQSHGMKDSAG
jgi:hypothetical protein